MHRLRCVVRWQKCLSDRNLVGKREGGRQRILPLARLISHALGNDPFNLESVSAKVAVLYASDRRAALGSTTIRHLDRNRIILPIISVGNFFSTEAYPLI